MQVYTLPAAFQTDNNTLRWSGKNTLELSRFKNDKEVSYTVDVKTGKKSPVQTSSVGTITMEEDALMREGRHLPEDAKLLANELGFSDHRTFLFAAARAGWRDIQEPIDLYELKGDAHGKLIRKRSMRIPLKGSLDSQAAELAPDGKHILWCFGQEVDLTNRNKIVYTFWVSGYLGANPHLVGRIEGKKESDRPNNIVWCVDSKHASFVWKHAVWQFLTN